MFMAVARVGMNAGCTHSCYYGRLGAVHFMAVRLAPLQRHQLQPGRRRGLALDRQTGSRPKLGEGLAGGAAFDDPLSQGKLYYSVGRHNSGIHWFRSG
jgi:hypothetical protein